MFKEWIGYFVTTLEIVAALLLTGIGWCPAILITSTIAPNADFLALTLIFCGVILIAVPTIKLFKKHNEKSGGIVAIKIFLIIVISFTAGMITGTENNDVISKFSASILSGGYDDGYDDGLAKGKEVAKEHYYDSGYEDGYIDGQNLSMGDNYNGVSYVYVTATGSKYHKLGCQYLSSSCYKISYQEAAYDGYEPCSRCY